MDILMIVDMQKGFITNNNKHIVKVINNLVKSNKFDKIIATKFVNKENSPFIEFLNWHEMLDTEQQKIVVELPKDAIIVEKTGYMLPSNVVVQNGICLKNQVLHLNKNDKIYLSGTDKNICVLAIALQLFDAGIPVKFILNAISSSHDINSMDLCNLKKFYKFNFGEGSIIE